MARAFIRINRNRPGFCFFDGGTGTLTELLVVWEMTNKKLLKKPIIVFGEFLTELVSGFQKRPSWVRNPCMKFARTCEGVLDLVSTELGALRK